MSIPHPEAGGQQSPGLEEESFPLDDDSVDNFFRLVVGLKSRLRFGSDTAAPPRGQGTARPIKMVLLDKFAPQGTFLQGFNTTAIPFAGVPLFG